ncbi:unnamed protein product [Rotaria socialis]|uniref:Uncharacterized protein n=1 Tax=Rotaria socialis TaxID=392032 RepID=A0A817XFT1_9BILA|nr:unnamed protein product [Rotaria socialis]
MHGYFMNIRLYNQAKSVAEPFAFAEYRKKKLHEKIYLKRVKSRVPMPIASIVNKDLAEKLQQNKSELNIKNKKKQKSLENKETPSILIDTRFQSLFTNLDMQIDANHKYFKSIAPLVSRLNKQTAVEDESISNENEEEEREDNLIDDILTSEEEKETTHRKTKLVPLDAINDTLIKKLFVHYFLNITFTYGCQQHVNGSTSLEQLIKLIDEIDNFKAMFRNKVARHEVISMDELDQFERNAVARPRLVEDKEKLRLERNRRNIEP